MNIDKIDIRDAFISFFLSYKNLNAKEFFSIWRLYFSIHQWQKYPIECEGKTVKAMRYHFSFCDYLIRRGNLVYIYFYKNKPIKAESFVDGLSDDEVLRLAQEACVSSLSHKIRFFELNSNKFDDVLKCSKRAVLARLLDYIDETKVNSILKEHGVPSKEWFRMKKNAYEGSYHVGSPYRTVDFFDKNILKQKIYEYKRSKIKLVR